jgi:trimeric autotransporter adhesin
MRLFRFAAFLIAALAPAIGFAQFNQSPLISTSMGGIVSGTYGYFKYISATNGLGAASTPDKIVSGTTNVTVISNTNTISITVGGTTTGYFNSNGVLTVPGISATAKLTSLTTLYASGLVGLGTTQPSATLHVLGTGILSQPNNQSFYQTDLGLGELNDHTSTNFSVRTFGNGTQTNLQFFATRFSGVFDFSRGDGNSFGAADMMRVAGASFNSTTFVLYPSGASITSGSSVTSSSYVALNEGANSYYNGSGNFGIGTINPNAKLDVIGTISASNVYVTATTGTVSATYGYFKYISATFGSGGSLSETISINDLKDASASTVNNNLLMGTSTGNGISGSTSDNIAIGLGGVLVSDSGWDNAALGYQALHGNTSGPGNVAMGTQDLYTNSTGSENVAIGYQTLYSNSTGSNNIGLGYQALYNNTAGDNVAIGYLALNGNTTGSVNVAMGSLALLHNSSGAALTGLGTHALLNNTTGSGNVGVGYEAMSNNTTGNNNVGVGYQALNSNVAGSSNVGVGFAAGSGLGGNDNIAIGIASLATSSTGNGNVAIGTLSLNKNTGSINVAIGASAMANATTAGSNVAIGYTALLNNSTGSDNVGVGVGALQNTTANGNIGIGSGTIGNNITGSQNVAIGYFALNNNNNANNVAIGHQAAQNITGSQNAIVGAFAGYGVSGTSTYSDAAILGQNAGNGLTTGNQNTFIGSQAGKTVTTGAGNIILGYNTQASTATTNNQLNIGNSIFGDMTNGHAGAGGAALIGINVVTPSVALEVSGTISATGLAVNGVNITGGGSDRIVSGTGNRTSIIANSATSIISITNASVTTGYFNSNGVLTAPGISATANLTSVTTLYASGLVGVGTSTPADSLHIKVANAKNGLLITDNTSGNGIQFQGSFPAVNFNEYWNGSAFDAIGAGYTSEINLNPTTGAFTFSVGANASANATSANTAVMTILNSGNVGIGTTSPNAKLDISGQGQISTGSICYWAAIFNSANLVGQFCPNPYSVSIRASNNIIAPEVDVTSDQRMKNWVADISPRRGLEVIERLRPLQYTWKKYPGHNMGPGLKAGFFAQEVEKYIPEAITILPDVFKDERHLDYEMVIPYTVSAIQELKAENDNLRVAHDGDHAAIESLRRDFEAYKRAHP